MALGGVLVRSRARGTLYAHVFSFRDGRVSRNDNFHDTAVWANVLG